MCLSSLGMLLFSVVLYFSTSTQKIQSQCCFHSAPNDPCKKKQKKMKQHWNENFPTISLSRREMCAGDGNWIIYSCRHARRNIVEGKFSRKKFVYDVFCRFAEWKKFENRQIFSVQENEKRKFELEQFFNFKDKRFYNPPQLVISSYFQQEFIQIYLNQTAFA